MSGREGYPAGVPCWVDTTQADPDAAVAFYRGLFGWDFEDRTPAGGAGRYAVASVGGLDVAGVGAQRDGSHGHGPAWGTYIAVDDADVAAAAVADAGGRVLSEPHDFGESGRMAAVADPAGAQFFVWQARRFPGARLVNAPGSWNWSDLYTRDIDEAEAFYGAVFGWRAVPVGQGYVLWTLPGYADFLERDDPGLRERHAAGGAPEGFSDAVAWLVQMTDDEFPEDAAPHWAVTFSVDDTDAAAERAVALGGSVVTPPFDAPPVRIATLADPQGAVFSVSRYRPDS